MVKILIIIMLVLIGTILYSINPTIVHVSIDTTMTFSEEKAIKTARVEIIQFARQCALEKVIPSNMTISSLVTSMCSEHASDIDETIAKSVFINSSLGGYITEEQYSIEKPQFGQDTFILRINYNAEIIPKFKERNESSYFDLTLNDNYVKSGSDITIKVKAYNDGFIYVFNFLSDNSVILMLPNLASKDNKVLREQAKDWTFTAYKDKESGSNVTVETIYVVYSVQEIFGWQKFKNNVNSQNIIFSAGEESFQLFQKWLSSTDSATTEEEMIQIHIY